MVEGSSFENCHGGNPIVSSNLTLTAKELGVGRYAWFKMKKEIKRIQKDIVRIFRSGLKSKPLYLCAKDNCSEASRLVAIWIKRKFSKADLFIVKGEYVSKKYHDVLAVQVDGRSYLIDPSVWQFFKNKRGIFMGEFNDVADVISYAKKTYGGKWKSVEKLKNFREENKLIKMIRNNL